MRDRKTPIKFLSGFSFLALVLSMIGIYGVLSYSVSQHTKEILIRAQLFQVSPLDIEVYGGVAVMLGLVAVAATVLPARRATKIDPMAALRCE